MIGLSTERSLYFTNLLCFPVVVLELSADLLAIHKALTPTKSGKGQCDRNQHPDNNGTGIKAIGPNLGPCQRRRQWAKIIANCLR